MEYDYIEQGDCLELMKGIPDRSVDLTVTSPPYDNLRTYNGGVDQWCFEKFQAISRELYRITKNGGVVVWVVNDATINGSETGTSFKQALYFKECGFNLHDTMIWKKDSCAFPDSVRYYQNFEYMFVLSKGKPKTFNPIEDRKNKYAGMNVYGTFRNKNGTMTNRSETWKSSVCKDFGCRFNVWEIPSEKANRTGHPAVFPKQIANDHILTWSNPGDIVFDPFLGSGTTAIAAVNTGRHYIGFELDGKYFQIACRRLDEAERGGHHPVL